MDDFEKIEYEEIKGRKITVDCKTTQTYKEKKKEQLIFKDGSTQTYEEDFEVFNLADDMERISFEILDEIKKGFKSLVASIL